MFTLNKFLEFLRQISTLALHVLLPLVGRYLLAPFAEEQQPHKTTNIIIFTWFIIIIDDLDTFCTDIC